MTTWAPGTTAPDGSRTVPAKEAVALPWPVAVFGKKNTLKTSTLNQTRDAMPRCLFRNKLVVSIGHLLTNGKSFDFLVHKLLEKTYGPTPAFGERRTVSAEILGRTGTA